jgi:hypothetical protein
VKFDYFITLGNGNIIVILNYSSKITCYIIWQLLLFIKTIAYINKKLKASEFDQDGKTLNQCGAILNPKCLQSIKLAAHISFPANSQRKIPE